ncbi:unnamed protein product, partial [Musa textilis]
KNSCKFSTNKSEQKIVLELLSDAQFELLPQDSYANYVIQCGLPLAKVSAKPRFNLQPHSTQRIFNHTTYCRRSFSTIHLKQPCEMICTMN